MFNFLNKKSNLGKKYQFQVKIMDKSKSILGKANQFWLKKFNFVKKSILGTKYQFWVQKNSYKFVIKKFNFGGKVQFWQLSSILLKKYSIRFNEKNINSSSKNSILVTVVNNIQFRLEIYNFNLKSIFG